MAIAYYLTKDGHRKRIPVETAHKIRAAMRSREPLPARQAEFIKNIEHVYITSRFTGQPTVPEYFNR